MATPLFTDDDASDLAYINIRKAENQRSRAARFHCEYLWMFYERHADKEFRVELRREFDARYWEMYLTTSLILSGHSVTCPKPGPDVGIIYRGQRIWFEATSPTGGAPGTSDHIPEPVMGRGYKVPNDKIILRYLSCIRDKYEGQYARWIAKGVVSEDDAFVIAVNPRSIPFDSSDTVPPRILQAAYTVGAPYISINRDTMEVVEEGYHFRNKVAKASGAEVLTGIFQQEKYQGVSALLCSRVNVANRPGEMGDDFQLATNPHALVPFPVSLRLRGKYFGAEPIDDGYRVTQT